MTRNTLVRILIVLAGCCLLLMILFPKIIGLLGSYILLLTLLAIVFYSWETSQLRMLSKRQIELSQEHMELSLKPYLEIVFQRAHVRLYNIGNGPAINVRVDDKIVSPGGYPERLRFICPAIIKKDECLPIEVRILTEDGKHEDESARLAFLTPPEAIETVKINVHFENLMGKEYAYMLNIGKDMFINSDPVDYMLQYLFESFPREINPRAIPALFVKPEDRNKLIQYCNEKGLTDSDPIRTDQEGIVEFDNLRITSKGIDYLKS